MDEIDHKLSSMSSVLRKLNLDNLISRFKEEKISPDIVCKLSLLELKELGLQSHSDIMALRIACVTFGAEQPRKIASACGPPTFDIPKSVLECYLEEDFTISEIASMMSVSESTIYRRMRLYGQSKLEFCDISDEELDHYVEETTKEFPRCGELLLKQLLYGKGVKVQRMRLRDSLHRVDELGVQERKKKRLQRRVYNVKGPNELWHVDTNHKLIRWNFVIVGGIDGFSRLPVMLECTDNNTAATLPKCFLEAVRQFGIPSRVRSDKGLENVGIADFMIEKRGGNRGSMITGPSTHNQRIERLWRDVYEGVLRLYYDLFYFMEDNQILDPLSDIHLAALHFVYLPKINEKLRTWQKAWSRHRIRTVRSSPFRLWLAGQMQDPVGPEVSTLDLNNYGVEGIVNDDQDNRGSRPVFCSLATEIDEQCKTELYSKRYTTLNYGIEDFKTAVEVIQRHNGN